MRARLEMGIGGAAMIGMAAALGIYGVRRYLAASKTAEAKATLGSMSRAVQAAFEREVVGVQGSAHALCGSAAAVPGDVPRGMKYQPNEEAGADWESGDDTAGWRCLRFALSQAHYYRYSYRAGSGYLGPSRGGPDPGPNGFEVAAEGDLDGDGKTSLFTITGTVDPQTQRLEVAPQVFVVDEYE
jgi:hypothetical protein